ncbi:MAG: tyrosine-type recombinase/integrase [Oscillospiraceae bacterium]
MKRVSTAKWYQKYKRWQINVQKDKVRRSFYSSKRGLCGKRECHEKADAWLEMFEDGRPNVSVMYMKFIDELKLRTSKSYWGNYEGYWRNWMHVSMKKKKMEQLTEQHFQDILNAAYKKGLSKKTLRNMRGCFSSFLKFCRKAKKTSLTTEHLYIPKKAPEKERVILQPNDLHILFSRDTTLFNKDDKYEPLVFAFRLQTATGMRPGEVLGLKWEDLDFKRGLISIVRSINVQREFTTGKNDNAIRSFAMTKLTRSTLIGHLFRNGMVSEYVFSLKGTWVRPSTFYDRWIKYRNHQRITHASPYCLRHTFISVIKCLPVGVVKPLVGHSVNMDTYKVYGHELEGEKAQAASLVQTEFEKHVPLMKQLV